VAAATFPIDPKAGAEPMRLTKTGGQVFSEMTAEAKPSR
jgi:hypothetical protein